MLQQNSPHLLPAVVYVRLLARPRDRPVEVRVHSDEALHGSEVLPLEGRVLVGVLLELEVEALRPVAQVLEPVCVVICG